MYRQRSLSQSTSTRAPKRSLSEKVAELLVPFSKAELSPFDMIVVLVDENTAGFHKYRAKLYHPDNTKLATILDSIASSKGGREKLKEWMRGDQGAGIVGEMIGEELDGLRSSYTLKGVADITPEYIMDRSPNSFSDDVPFTYGILKAAAQTKRQLNENTTKSPEQVCISLIVEGILTDQPTHLLTAVRYHGPTASLLTVQPLSWLSDRDGLVFLGNWVLEGRYRSCKHLRSIRSISVCPQKPRESGRSLHGTCHYRCVRVSCLLLR